MAKWAKWNAVEFIDYIDFEENFHWGWDFTPEHASEQMRSDHVEKEKRVQIDAASKAPKQPNFFKRWFQSMNQNWQEQNKAYKDHVKEQQLAVG